MKRYRITLTRFALALTSQEAAQKAWADMRRDLWPRLTVVSLEDEHTSEIQTERDAP